jgi:hypothetical protein
MPSCCTTASAPAHAVDFYDKHKVSLDWLLCGNLNGLQRMTQEARAESLEISEAQRQEVTRLFFALSPKMQLVAFGCMRELMSRSQSNG